jgi:hypothetical protein
LYLSDGRANSGGGLCVECDEYIHLPDPIISTARLDAGIALVTTRLWTKRNACGGNLSDSKMAQLAFGRFCAATGVILHDFSGHA